MRRFEVAAALLVALLGLAIVALALLGGPRPLTVVSVVPADHAADVPTGSQVVVVFSRPVDAAATRSALSVSPVVEGLVSAAGRRLAFTPKAGFRADTDYTITVGPGARDRGARALGEPVVSRFRTRPQTLVLRTADGRLLAARQEADGVADTRPLASGVGDAFAVGPAGEATFVAEGRLVVTDERGTPRHRVSLPGDARLVALGWAAGGHAVVGLAHLANGGSVALQVRLDVPAPVVVPFAGGLAPAGRHTGVEAAKVRLSRETGAARRLAVMPDGQSVILRNEALAFAAFGLEGTERRTFGAFLAVGGPSPTGESVVFERTGRLRLLSPQGRDSHDPRFATRHERVVFASAPAEGPIERRLTAPPPGFTDGEPRWSPDDAWVLFRRWPVGRPEAAAVWIAPADGATRARPLGDGIVDARWYP